MVNEATLNVTMDAELKERAEELYRRLGTSLSEAVRIFARQSVEEDAMPFTPHIPIDRHERGFGIARGKFTVPDDFDRQREEVMTAFGIEQ